MRSRMAMPAAFGCSHRLRRLPQENSWKGWPSRAVWHRSCASRHESLCSTPANTWAVAAENCFYCNFTKGRFGGNLTLLWHLKCIN